MATVTISPRFQIVIPEEVRHALKPEAGQKVIIKLEGELAALARSTPCRQHVPCLQGSTHMFPTIPKTGLAQISPEHERHARKPQQGGTMPPCFLSSWPLSVTTCLAPSRRRCSLPVGLAARLQAAGCRRSLPHRPSRARSRGPKAGRQAGPVQRALPWPDASLATPPCPTTARALRARCRSATDWRSSHRPALHCRHPARLRRPSHRHSSPALRCGWYRGRRPPSAPARR